MKKIYITPSVELTEIQISNVMISLSISTDEGTHVAESKEIDPWESDDVDF